MNFAAFALANLLGGYAKGRQERLEFEEDKRYRDRTLRLSEEQLNEQKAQRKWEQEEAAYKRDQEEYSQWIERAQTAANALNPEAVASAVDQANRIAQKRGFAKLDPDMFRPGAKTVAEYLGKVAETGLPWSVVAPGVHWGLGTQAPPPAGAAAPAFSSPAPAAPAAAVTPALGVVGALRPAQPAMSSGVLRWPPASLPSGGVPPPGASVGATTSGPARAASPDLLEKPYEKLVRRAAVKTAIDDLAKLALGGSYGDELQSFVHFVTGEKDPGEAVESSGVSLRRDEIKSKIEKNLSEAELNRMRTAYIPEEMLLKEKELELKAKEQERKWWLNRKDFELRAKAQEARLALARHRLEIDRYLAGLQAQELDLKRWRDIEYLKARNLETAALSASWDTPLNQKIAKDAWRAANSLPGPGKGAPPAKGAAPGAGTPPTGRKAGTSLSPEDRQLYRWRKGGLVLPGGEKVSPAEVNAFVRKAMLDKKSNAQIVGILRRWGAK